MTSTAQIDGAPGTLKTISPVAGSSAEPEGHALSKVVHSAISATLAEAPVVTSTCTRSQTLGLPLSFAARLTMPTMVCASAQRSSKSAEAAAASAEKCGGIASVAATQERAGARVAEGG